jgi:hypothetical protein
MSMVGGGSFVTMPSTYGAVGGYGGYGGYAAPAYGGYSAYPSYGGYTTPAYGYGGYGGYGSYGNPLLEGMPMGYLGVGSTEEKPAAPKKTRAVTLKKKVKGCGCC